MDYKKDSEKGILFFVKLPLPGKVKRRLSSKTNDKFIVALYQKFVEDLLRMLDETDYPVLICYEPPSAIKNFQEWLGSKYQYIPQIGNDLGERIKNGFIKGFNLGFNHLIVIGSDSPDLSKNIIEEAFQNLNEYDAVIGPCLDGGYYLIGFTNNTFSPKFFSGIHWSTYTVLKMTLKLLEQENLGTHILPIWRDVDTWDDLEDLYQRNKCTEFNKSVTMKILRKYFQKTERK